MLNLRKLIEETMPLTSAAIKVAEKLTSDGVKQINVHFIDANIRTDAHTMPLYNTTQMVHECFHKIMNEFKDHINGSNGQLYRDAIISEFQSQSKYQNVDDRFSVTIQTAHTMYSFGKYVPSGIALIFVNDIPDPHRIGEQMIMAAFDAAYSNTIINLIKQIENDNTFRAVRYNDTQRVAASSASVVDQMIEREVIAAFGTASVKMADILFCRFPELANMFFESYDFVKIIFVDKNHFNLRDIIKYIIDTNDMEIDDDLWSVNKSDDNIILFFLNNDIINIGKYAYENSYGDTISVPIILVDASKTTNDAVVDKIGIMLEMIIDHKYDLFPNDWDEERFIKINCLKDAETALKGG